jgi:hypothetical protein
MLPNGLYEMVNKQHAPYYGTTQLFYAGREVGLGFPGRMKATALRCTA